MFHTYIFSYLFHCLPFGGSQPLQAGVLVPLGYETGLVVGPKLNFSKLLPISLWVQVKILENSLLYLLELWEVMLGERVHGLLGWADEAGNEGGGPLSRWPPGRHCGPLKSIHKASGSSPGVIFCALTPEGSWDPVAAGATGAGASCWDARS